MECKSYRFAAFGPGGLAMKSYKFTDRGPVGGVQVIQICSLWLRGVERGLAPGIGLTPGFGPGGVALKGPQIFLRLVGRRAKTVCHYFQTLD